VKTEVCRWGHCGPKLGLHQEKEEAFRAKQKRRRGRGEIGLEKKWSKNRVSHSFSTLLFEVFSSEWFLFGPFFVIFLWVNFFMLPISQIHVYKYA